MISILFSKQLYGLYKQAKSGPPSTHDVENKLLSASANTKAERVAYAQLSAWRSCEHLSSTEAKEEFLIKLFQYDEEWDYHSVLN